jgi:hypothetical protein
VLNALLGGTMSSRLFQKVREERGLAYSVYSAVNAFRDAGVLMVYAGTSPDKGDELLSVVRDELRDLRDKGPSAGEVAGEKHPRGFHAARVDLSRVESGASGDVTIAPSMAKYWSAWISSRGPTHRMARRVFQPGVPALAAVGRTRALKAVRTGFSL